ncbi:MAG TPA: DUF535 family protein, partial [Burkholderiaceae bacterium]
EGEMALQLYAGNALVCSLAFVFDATGARPFVRVGCVQGPKSGDGLDLARLATRDAHGLRPKQLLLAVARELGRVMGCTHLSLVGNANRVVCSALKEGKVMANYNQLWQETGAVEQSDGDFNLPCTRIPPPALDEIVSKKRAEAKRRYALLEEVVDLASAHFRTGPRW